MSEEPTNAQLVAIVAVQHQTIAELRADVEVLKARLAASSRNSSKPPSTDGLGKPAPRSLRGKSGRKPGGQGGHPGRTLRQVSDPDEIVRHEPGGCAGCGRDGSVKVNWPHCVMPSWPRFEQQPALESVG